MAPITVTTSGFGRLIQARFDRMIDAQKVLAAVSLWHAADGLRPRLIPAFGGREESDASLG
jgi:adenine C2-methylase RlmN of 23S rRNA A2503 and tRNA A37